VLHSKNPAEDVRSALKIRLPSTAYRTQAGPVGDPDRVPSRNI